LTLTADTTLTKTTNASLGATSSQYAIIIASPASAAITITAPAASKTYVVNNTSGTYSVTFKATGQTGVTLAVNEKAVLAFNGTDFVKITPPFDGTNLTLTGAATATRFIPSGSTVPTNGMYLSAANNVNIATNSTNRIDFTAAGYSRPVAYADTVSALGNTGTAITITCTNANVFTATLTGNCTFTLASAIATGSSSFTLILTNDATASRTVAWAGGTFKFPNGSAALARTTTANATDIWVFFTPDGGTTWYGNISMKNMSV
jgi:hypothetical protein